MKSINKLFSQPLISKLARHHLGPAFLFFSLTITQQNGFFYLKNLNFPPLTIEKYLGLLVFMLLATFFKGQLTRFVAMGMMIFLNFFQMAHLSYFGTQILPSEILLLFTQTNEIAGTLGKEGSLLILPFVITVIPLLIGWYVLKKSSPVREWKPLNYLFVLYLLYNPARTWITGNTWGRQPSSREYSGFNVYLSFSYFAGRILPAKLFSPRHPGHDKNKSFELSLTDSSESWDKIIVVLGESLTPYHMQLYGYNRDTTPFLNTLKNDPQFYHSIALSSGVSTDISVIFFLNTTYGHPGVKKATTGEHCLFRLAKQRQYQTHFISNQSGQQLRYILPYLCHGNLESLRFLEHIKPGTDENSAPDSNLIPPFRELVSQKDKQFIILHQRGSHAPWEARSTPPAQKFKGTGDEKRIADYDNSVVEFDEFWRQLDQELRVQSQKILVLYLSDHGQTLGQDGRWGHGFLYPRAFEIPLMIKTYNAPLPGIVKKLPKFVPQYNLGLFLIQQLGFSLNQPVEKPVEDFIILGNDIDGFAGNAELSFLPEGYTFQLRE